MTNDWRTSWDTDRRMLWIWRNMAKQPAAVFLTWVFMNKSECSQITKSRTEDVGMTKSFPTLSVFAGSWPCWRLDDAHMISVLAVFNCSRLERIHAARSSMHADICYCSRRLSAGWQKLYTCILVMCTVLSWNMQCDYKTCVWESADMYVEAQIQEYIYSVQHDVWLVSICYIRLVYLDCWHLDSQERTVVT